MWKSYFLFSSIAEMSSLKQLDLCRNNLSRDDQLSQTLSALTNLEKLNLSRCHLTKIPDR
jgi:Leucine-rich repeat (LRR) protein